METIFSEIKNVISNLRKETTLANIEAVLQHFSFEVLVEKSLASKKDTQSKMTVAYLKDIYSLLASVATVRRLSTAYGSRKRHVKMLFCYSITLIIPDICLFNMFIYQI